MSKIANRRSPSGPQISLQLPYYTTVPVSGVTYFVPLSAGTAVITELGTEYEIPTGNALAGAQAGRLDTLEIKNDPVGTDVGVVTYRIRKNGNATGPALEIANDSADPVAVDLSAIAVAKGDLISISVECPVLAGTAPQARLFLSWLPQGST